MAGSMKTGYHRLELNKATWEVPVRYTGLAGIGAGAYGQVRHCHRTFSPIYRPFLQNKTSNHQLSGTFVILHWLFYMR